MNTSQLFVATALILLTVDAAPGPLSVRPGENIAAGKSYALSPPPNYAHCTDPDDARQLTDGIYTTGYFWTQKSTVGWQNAQPVVITIDLGKVEPIGGASFNTAAGVAGVTWPTGIFVLVSDNGREFHEVGELVSAGAAQRTPPSAGYAVHRFSTDRLRTHGRYVMFVVVGGSYVFADELEVYRGEAALLATPIAGEAVTDAAAFVRTRQVVLGVARRLRADAQAVRELATNGAISAVIRQEVTEGLAQVEAGIGSLPRQYDASFRAVLPLNGLHAEVFRAQAKLWRATGADGLMVWQSGLWDPLLPIQAAPTGGKAAVTAALMRNEFRAGAFNVSNARETDAKLSLRITGMPGGENPSWITVQEVEWTDTRSGVPVAAALPGAKREGGAFIIEAKSGLTRQVWLTFHPSDVSPGLYEGRILLAGNGAALEVPLSVRVYPLSFPERPSLHLGGWDYTDTARHLDITAENRPLVIAHLREHWVDSPWATAAVLPAGSYDGEGRQTTAPETARFEEWVRRWPKAERYCVFMNVSAQWAGARLGTPGFEQRVGMWVRFWAQQAQRCGLKPEQLALLLVDEPTQPEQDAIILGWTKAIHAAGTGIKVWEDPTHADPAAASQEMLAACDVLCPNRPKFLGEPKVRTYFAQHRPAGVELAFYSCSGPARLLDPYSYYRLQAWTCWEQGARSSYFWAFSDAGGGSSWNEYSARGPGYLPFFMDGSSVTAGKQMEAIRESAEDYEYLVLLRDGVAACERRGRSHPVLGRARKLLAEGASRVCNAKGASALTWATDKDRAVADRVRVEVLDTLVELSRGAKP